MKSLRAWLRRGWSACSRPARPSGSCSAEIESHLQHAHRRQRPRRHDAGRGAAARGDRARRRRGHQGGVSRSARAAGARIAGARPALRHAHADARAPASRSPASSFSASASASTPRSSRSSTPWCCRPLPFADADRIMRIWHTPPQAHVPGDEDVLAVARQLHRLGSAEPRRSRRWRSIAAAGRR